MDRLYFPDSRFDVVTASMSIHETAPEVRRAALSEIARVLKPGGVFIPVEWRRPCFGLLGVIWYPLVRLGEKNRDNWNNVYPHLYRERGLSLESDAYLNSIFLRVWTST